MGWLICTDWPVTGRRHCRDGPLMRPNNDIEVTRQPRGALFLVRAWNEGDQFRARIWWSVGTLSDIHPWTEAVTADPENVHRLLGVWIDELMACPPTDDD
jgi:hypothetical protein